MNTLSFDKIKNTIEEKTMLTLDQLINFLSQKTKIQEREMVDLYFKWEGKIIGSCGSSILSDHIKHPGMEFHTFKINEEEFDIKIISFPSSELDKEGDSDEYEYKYLVIWKGKYLICNAITT